MDRLVAIVGPTGIGKTSISIELAKQFNAEIISADSRQVYRYMDIGTAKPSKEELTAVPHHLIDIVNPDEDFNLATYKRLACKAITDIQSRGKLPFLVGGTGQYIWAVVEGWVIPEVAPNMEYRRALEKKAEAGNGLELYRELLKIDSSAAEKIDPRNVRRVIRALEVNKEASEQFSKIRKKEPPQFETSIIGLTAERKDLYRRVDERVNGMIKNGFVEEVKRLIVMSYDPDLPSMSSIGYREIAQYLQGVITLDEAVYKIKIGTHRFIRHQYAWFRLDNERIKWFNSETNGQDEVEDFIHKH